MKEAWNFAVLRGDRRQNLLCDLLRADGHSACLLPEPERWKQENLPPPGTLLLAARADETLRRASEEAGLRLLEYGSLPAFQRENGCITAENALQVAMKHRLRTLRGSDALVVGWGNIGRPLFALLSALGAETAVAVRREEQLSQLREQGISAFLSTRLEQEAERYDLIFNTAPTLLFSGAVLRQLRPGALLIDLASRPGGVDWESAQQLGIKAVQALALPGSLTPVSGAIAIRNAVYALCEEESS